MAQAHRNRVFHDFRQGLCRNLVCSGKKIKPKHNTSYCSIKIIQYIVWQGRKVRNIQQIRLRHSFRIILQSPEHWCDRTHEPQGECSDSHEYSGEYSTYT